MSNFYWLLVTPWCQRHQSRPLAHRAVGGLEGAQHAQGVLAVVDWLGAALDAVNKMIALGGQGLRAGDAGHDDVAVADLHAKSTEAVGVDRLALDGDRLVVDPQRLGQ